MTPRRALQSFAFIAVLSLLGLGSAHAQIGGPGPGGPGQPGGPQPTQKKEGVAEEAPEPPASLPTTPILPPQKSESKRWMMPRFGGYFRFRGDWFKQLDLGHIDDPDQGGAAFPNALACLDQTDLSKPCEGTVKSANIRMRLEPTISLQENTTQVHMQIDILDNVVLGSTPTSYLGDGTATRGDLPLEAFSEGQQAPEAGRNAQQDSIRVKRVWAEVETAVGRLHFGRMPWQWGVGIYANSGGYDPIHGTYDYDSDFATTVDRLMFARGIPGTDFVASVAMDWTSVAPTRAQTGYFAQQYEGQPFDADDNDDVNQWVFTIARLDKPKDFDERVKKGLLALNYGAFLAYRTQDFDVVNDTLGTEPPAEDFVPRGLKAYIPDLWVRLAYGNFDFEFEGVSVLGRVNSVADQTNPDNNNAIAGRLNLRQFGAVMKTGYRLVDGDMRLGLQMGFASGDQWDSEVPGRTHVRFARRFPGQGDNTINAYRFNFSHEVDMILFRELLGTVTNATYAKPNMDWKIGGGFRAKAAAIFSFANVPVATPGNGGVYGVELNADIGYQGKGFFAGIAYGVLFPGGALNHNGDDGQGGPGFGFSAANTTDADTAQTIQTRFGVSF